MKLIYTVQEVKFLNNYFKMNSEKSEEEFLSGVLHLLNKSPAMYQGFISSYKSGKYLQPGYLTEINVCATLAAMFNLYYDENINEVNLRHQYSDGEGNYLKEYGGCGMSDIYLITAAGTVTTIEVKEPLSLGGDYDLGITEEGKLFPKIAANREFPESAQKILNEFNAVDSIFNHLGHNIKLSNTNYLSDILNSYLGDKNIDYIATYSEATNSLLYFPVTELHEHVSFEGSEIRTAGKNHVNVYTPNAFKKAMLDIGCTINADNVVAIPKATAGLRIARGSNRRITGVKINSIFYFEIGDILKEDDEFYYANISRGKQLKQGISVHLNLQ